MANNNTTSSINQRELKFGYWFITRKLLFKRILIGILVFFNILIWGYSAWGLVNIYLINTSERQLMLSILPQNLVNFAELRTQNEPQSLSVSKITVISTGGGQYDLVARIKNPNTKWGIDSFDYQFIGSGLTTESNSNFILPGEEKFITDLRVKSKIRPSNLNLNITNIKWKRFDAHEISNYEEFYNSRLGGLIIDNIKFNPPSTSGLGDKLPISRATFDIYNNTAYNYWQVGFFISLYRGNTLTAINYVTANQLMSGDKLSLEARWFEPLSSITSVKIEPEVNILDLLSYMEFEESPKAMER